MNLDQQKHLDALLDAAVRLHKMSLIQGDAPFDGHSTIPDSVGDDLNCEYCGIINQAEYTLTEKYAAPAEGPRIDCLCGDVFTTTEDMAMHLWMAHGHEVPPADEGEDYRVAEGDDQREVKGY